VKKKSKAKKKAKRRMKTVSLRIDHALKEKLERIATDADTEIHVVIQVLLATGMHMGRNSQDVALQDALATIMDLQGKLHSCRTFMEANDPINAAHVFGPPLTPAEPASTPAPEPPV